MQQKFNVCEFHSIHNALQMIGHLLTVLWINQLTTWYRMLCVMYIISLLSKFSHQPLEKKKKYLHQEKTTLFLTRNLD